MAVCFIIEKITDPDPDIVADNKRYETQYIGPFETHEEAENFGDFELASVCTVAVNIWYMNKPEDIKT